MNDENISDEKGRGAMSDSESPAGVMRRAAGLMRERAGWLDAAAATAEHYEAEGASVHPDSRALKAARAYLSEHWCVAWGGEDANDCAGLLEYDDEAGAQEMTQWIDGSFVARQMVIRLPWETVPQEAS